MKSVKKAAPRPALTITPDRLEVSAEMFHTIHAMAGPWTTRVEEDFSETQLSVEIGRYSDDGEGPRSGTLRPVGTRHGMWVAGLVSPLDLRQLGLAIIAAADALDTARARA